MDIWELAYQKKQEIALQKEREDKTRNDEWPKNFRNQTITEPQQHERSIIFCGDRNSGKTTIINRFLDKSENPKPTIALEYAYGRRTRGTVCELYIIKSNTELLNTLYAENIISLQVRDLVHVWELGGTSSLTNLLEIPLSASKIELTSLVIVLDMTKFDRIWNTFYRLIDTARKLINTVIEDTKHHCPSAYTQITQRIMKFSDHQDCKALDPFPIPLVIVGSKYDEFQDYDPELRKNICKYLRYMAHSNTATLQMFSSKIENSVLKMKAQIGHLAFGSSASKTVVTESNKPIYIPAGKDSYEDIGSPPNIDFPMSQMTTARAFDVWNDAFTSQYPRKEVEKENKDEFVNDPQFKDADIDRLLEQKTKDLEEFIKRKKDRQRFEEHTHQ